MSRHPFAPAVGLLLCALSGSTAFAQAKAKAPPAVAKAAPVTPAPAAPTKFVKPIKGTATVEYIKGKSNRVGSDIVTVMKVRNTSSGSISLLKIDEYWYDHKRNVVTGDSQPYRRPFNPGEIIEITLKSPYKPGMDLYVSQWMFSHANGDVKVTEVKKF